MSTPEAFVARARSFVGTPFGHQGRQPGKALDCVGHLRTAAFLEGLTTFDLLDYGRTPDGTLVEVLETHLVRVPQNHMRPADVVLFRYDLGPSHVGIVGDYPGRPDVLTLIHADNKRKRVVEHRLFGDLADRIAQVYRVPAFME